MGYQVKPEFFYDSNIILVREFSSSQKRIITDPWVKEWTNHLTDGPEISLFVYYFKPFCFVFFCVRLWNPSKHSSLINVRIWRMVKRQIYPLSLCLDTRSSSVKLDGGWGSPYQPAAKLERQISPARCFTTDITPNWTLLGTDMAVL